jgi:predicted transcriptional regulator
MEQTVCELLKQKKFYSTGNIARVLKMTRKAVNWHMFNCPDFCLVDPMEVGSGKQTVMVWKLTQQAQ